MTRRTWFCTLTVILLLAGLQPGRAADDEDPDLFGKRASEWLVILEKDTTVKQRRRAAIARISSGASMRSWTDTPER